jgi:regulatory protein
MDIEQKLHQWKAEDITIQKIINRLEKEDFLNEERYAKAFAVGKLRHNKWGRNKIIYALQQKHIPDLYIQIGIGEIDEEEYLNTLKALLSSKKIDEKDDWKRNNKLVRYAIQKGYQADLCWKIINGEL